MPAQVRVGDSAFASSAVQAWFAECSLHGELFDACTQHADLKVTAPSFADSVARLSPGSFDEDGEIALCRLKHVRSGDTSKCIFSLG